MKSLMRAIAFAATVLAAIPAQAQTGTVDDKTCLVMMTFVRYQASDADVKATAEHLQHYYLGKIRAVNPAFSLSNFFGSELDKYGEVDVSATGSKCIASAEDDITTLGSVNKLLEEK